MFKNLDLAQIKSNFLALFDWDFLLLGGKDSAFTMALVALSAKMAKADGVVSATEISAFFEILEDESIEPRQVERLFELAMQDVAGFESYAKKIVKLFNEEHATLEHVVDLLFHIAKADGVVHEKEYAFLERVGKIFGFTEACFLKIASRHLHTQSDNAYVVLGLEPDVSDGDLKTHYRALVKANHPDQLIADGVPAHLVGLATQKIAAINDAYEQIKKERGL